MIKTDKRRSFMAGLVPIGPTSRRRLLRAMFTLGAVAGTAAALAPIVSAGRRASAAEGARPPAAGPGAVAAGGGGPLSDEMYRGRRIQVGAAGSPPTAPFTPASAVSAGGPPASGAPFGIRIDGRPLHIMRRADGSYLSAVNHYESFPTLLETARAAVDDLAGAQLSVSGPIHHL
jgi:hypothetical protein